MRLMGPQPVGPVGMTVTLLGEPVTWVAGPIVQGSKSVPCWLQELRGS